MQLYYLSMHLIIHLTSIFFLSMLVSFISTWHKSESFRKRCSQLRNATLRLAWGQVYEVLVCLVINVGEPRLLVTVLSLGKMVLACIRRQVEHIMGASQYAVLLNGFFLSSCLHVSTLSSCLDFAWWWNPSVIWNKPIIPHVGFGCSVVQQ